MEYRKFDQDYVIRLNPGEEIVTCLTELAKAEEIVLASVSGLGAVNDVTVGVFSPKTKQYKANCFRGDYEIVSLTGTLTTQNALPYPHLHLAVGDEQGQVFGGHLNRAVVSATAEIVVHCMNGTVERQFNEEIGLNLMHFLP